MRSFDLGRIKVTPAASAALAKAGVDPSTYLARHRAGDWGDVEDWMAAHNAWGVERPAILRSRYALPDGPYLAVATARDRSYTQVMLEREFDRREVSVQEGYACWAETYDLELNPLIAVEEPHVVAHLDVLLEASERTTALDVCAGTGRLALKLARRGVAVTAFDASAEMLALAEAKARQEGLPIAFHRGALEDGLPFAQAAFDLVTCALALCHVPGLDRVVHDFYRVLRTGGYLLISDFHPDAVAELGWRTVKSRPEGRYLLPNLPYTRADYLDAVRAAGLILVDVQDLPVRDVPRAYVAFYDRMVEECGDTNFCLIVLAQKP